jgi:ABC-type phosphate transport system substrate-binding protein
MRMRNWRLTLLVPIVALLLPITASAATAGQIVIANESVVADSLAMENLERVFLGRGMKVDGQRVGVVVLAGGETHQGFLASYLKKNPRQFLSHWRKLCFTGQGTMPSTARTESELVERVASTPGAIGYIDAGTPHDGVKVLAILE